MEDVTQSRSDYDDWKIKDDQVCVKENQPCFNFHENHLQDRQYCCRGLECRDYLGYPTCKQVNYTGMFNIHQGLNII